MILLKHKTKNLEDLSDKEFLKIKALCDQRREERIKNISRFEILTNPDKYCTEKEFKLHIEEWRRFS